jgi:hypothetical protein
VAIPWWTGTPPVRPSHSLAPEGSCDIELRELLATKDLLEWWRLVALLLALVCALLAVAAACLALCLAGLCRCCWAANARSGPRTPVRPSSPSAGDHRVLELLAAAEVRR